MQLLEYLGERRFKAASKLHAVISAKRAEAFHSLKKCSRLIDIQPHQFKEEANETNQRPSCRLLPES